MESAFYVATAAQKVLQRQLDTVAHNIANSTTVGFRAENVSFDTVLSTAGDQSVNFPVEAGMHPSTAQGTLQQTGNPLDIALSGEGWFAIETPQGVAYTRDGRLSISQFGELQSIEGYPVLDASAAPIQLDTRSGPPTVYPDGRLEVNGRIVGNIGVFEMPPENLTVRFGNSGFLAAGEALPLSPEAGTTVNQGFIEGSNVNPMLELANMIAISRNFESASSIVQRADDSVAKSVRELAK